MSLADLAHAALRVQILLFQHTKFSKCNRLRSPHGPRPLLREILDPPLNATTINLVIIKPAGVAEWMARQLDLREVPSSGPGNIECRPWCIHPGFKIHGQSQPKSETENTSGSTKY